MWLYGASGHGKVIQDILDAGGRHVDGFVDDNPEFEELAGLPVVHSTEDVDEMIVSIGENETRKKIARKLDCKVAEAAVHPSAVVAATARLEEGTVVMAAAVVNAEARIGRHCIINTGASIDHECLVGDFVHISPHATLCGNVTVGEGTWVGAGTTIIQGVKIGRWCMIGAGSVVTHDIPDGWLAMGNRCRLIKQINQDMLKSQTKMGGGKWLISSSLYLEYCQSSRRRGYSYAA